MASISRDNACGQLLISNVIQGVRIVGHAFCQSYCLNYYVQIVYPLAGTVRNYSRGQNKSHTPCVQWSDSYS